MAQAGGSGADWVSGWIEQQREILRQQARQQGEVHSDAHQLGLRWLELGQSYLYGLMQQAQPDASAPGTGAVPPFKLTDEYMQAWRNAAAGFTQEQDSASQRFAQMLGRLPPLGPARQHTEAWRELIAAEAECRKLAQQLNGVLAQVQADALDLLEQRVRERKQAGESLDSHRALYDLWVECGEQVYARVAHSDAYCRLQAELGNASMRLRARQQALIEHSLKQFDLPTRSELNTVHRQLRDLRQRLDALQAAAAPVAHGSAAKKRSKHAGAKPAPRRQAPRKSKSRSQ